VNNKIHSTTKVSLFIANYGREVRMGGDIWKKGKVEKAMEFVERMKRVQEKVGAALKKAQEEMKRYADKKRKEVEDWKKGDKVMLSTKENAVKLQLPSSMRIHPVVNISQIVQYKEQVKG